MLSNWKVAEEQKPEYAGFEEPDTSKADAFKTNASLQWAYGEYSSTTNKTNFTLGSLNDSKSGNVTWTSIVVPDMWKMQYLNKKVALLRSAGNSSHYQIYRYNKTRGNYSKGENITALVKNLIQNSNFTDSSIKQAEWVLSEVGDRMRIGKHLFFKNPNNIFVAMTVHNNFVMAASNKNLTYAIGADGNLWRFVASRSGFVQAVSSSRPLPRDAEVRVFDNKIIVNSSNATSVQVHVFVAVDRAVEPFFNFTSFRYTKKPRVIISEKLTKVVILGKVLKRNSTEEKVKADAYHLDFAKKTYTNISFPMEAIGELNATDVKVGDSFIYARQQESETNKTGKKECAYYLSQDSIPVKAYEKDLTKLNAS